MHISWLGTTAVRIQTKNEGNDVNIVIDPYKPKVGDFPRSLTPQIALFTRGQEDSITLSGEPFVLDTPGECDTKGVLVSAVEGHGENDVMFRIDLEQMSIGHLGLVSKFPVQKQKDLLSDVDVLLIPVGHPDAYDPEKAMKLINELGPRIVIPIAFKSKNDPKADGVEKFVKAMGMSADKLEKKAIIKKKDLPQEDTQLIILAKE